MIKEIIKIKSNGVTKRFFLGFNGLQINLDDIREKHKLSKNSQVIDYLLNLLTDMNNKHPQAVLQILNPEFLLSKDHLIRAFYHAQKAFDTKMNISNQKSIELLLYLSATRQISEAFNRFGIKISNEKSNSNIEFVYFIANNEDTIDLIKNQLVNNIPAKENFSIISEISIKKIAEIIGTYGITINQIGVVFQSYDIPFKYENALENNNLKDLHNAIQDIILEKMALLSLEKITND